MGDQPLYSDLQKLKTELAEETVLSIYISAEDHDFARRAAWRARLASLLEKEEDDLPADQDREDFLAAVGKLEAELRPVKGFLPGTGWAAFVTKERVWWSGEVLAPTPDLVRWGQGPVLAPFLRALKQERPVAIALVDSRHSRIFRYLNKELSEIRTLNAAVNADDPAARGGSKRGSGLPGSRGKSASDAVQRSQLVERDRMLKDLAHEIPEIARGDGFVVIGGTPEATAAAGRVVGPLVGDRLRLEPSLYLTMSPPQLREAAEEIASEMSEERQTRLVDEILDLALSGGHGAHGEAETRAALRAGQVSHLLISGAYAASNAEEAEELITRAMQSGAVAETVGGAASERLDAAGGVCARLRFVAHVDPEPKEAAGIAGS